MKFFKSTLAVAMAAVMMIGVSACGQKEEQPADTTTEQQGETAENTEAKKYIIATDTTFAPFEFEDKDGNFVGIDIDLINAIAEDQGFEIEIQSLGFNAAVQAVDAGQADGVIAGMSITDERKLSYDFSEPYFDSGVVMGIAADNEEIKSLLKGVEMVYEGLLNVLKSEGVELIETENAQFDPNYHHAVMQDEDSEKESGAILDTFQKGYKLKDRVIRPAMVKVNS